MSAPSWRPLAALLGGAGVLHFLAPRPFRAIVPPQLGDPAPWVAASGVAEMVCAAGLAVPGTRRPAAYAAAALLVGVFPANVWMAVDSAGRPAAYRAVAYARLPLQLPLILQAVRVARSPRAS